MVPGEISRVHFSWERPQGCIIPRSRGSVPAECIRFAFVSSLPCWGRPSGCIIPKPLGPDPVACIFLHLPKSICLPCLTCLRLSPARSSPPTGPPHRHGAGAWVRPCHVNKSEWSSSGSRHVPCMSPHQALSAFTSSGPTSGRLAAVTTNHVLLVPIHRYPAGRIASGTASLLFSHALRLHVKRGLLSIASQELLLPLQPSPSSLDHGITTWHTSGG